MYNPNLECTFIQVDWQHNDHNTGLNIYFSFVRMNQCSSFCLCFMQFKEWFFNWLDFIFLFQGLFEGPESLDVIWKFLCVFKDIYKVENFKLIPFLGGLSNTHQLFKLWKLCCVCFNLYKWLAFEFMRLVL